MLVEGNFGELVNLGIWHGKLWQIEGQFNSDKRKTLANCTELPEQNRPSVTCD